MPERASLTVVVPAYNEAAVLEEFHARLAGVLDALDVDGRVLYIDDGSRDATWALIEHLAARDARVTGLKLARNFGKELALTAGLDHVDADAALIIDADLQDPPELIPDFVARWREGFDVVYGQRLQRDGETWLKKATAAGFYRVMQRLSSTQIPADTGDFRLMSRRALDALHGLRERHRFMKGLFAWVGFRQVALAYRRDARAAGTSKFNYWKLWNFAIEGITSFSTAPLRIATYVGLLTAFGAFVFAAWIVAKTLLWGEPVAGYPTIMTAILFLGGAQLMALGVIGEYLGRLYMESKARPLYLIDTLIGARPACAAPQTLRPDVSGLSSR
ncbi:glycosyltransferase family 2 protein [Chiayiivirga flava]|uniref:Glycosyltransferase involved in cell wall biosynthesis n=1 Tax=Chiayiivirga flava TaxID=659595 RepID=A0A7W8D6L7_9GAMM|nr:glycosyltransferase family 2 protein [Chiayiivirga flava]MBB5208855.1 glycosyltransferase involved in cell wall biosynthesis [Chiayiivirga flava]